MGQLIAGCKGQEFVGISKQTSRPNTLSHESAEARAAADRRAHEIKTFVGTSAVIELRPEGGVERSLGKAKRVVDKRREFSRP